MVYRVLLIELQKENAMSVTRKDKRQAWEAIIKQCENSDQRTVDFCREKALNIATFYYWKKKLSDEKPPVSAFTEVKNPSNDGAGLWFDFGNGARLVIDSGFDQITLKRLMGTLEEC